MPDKSLGQHWLKNREILQHIAAFAELTDQDTVLEIGPGPGTLTSVLLSDAKQVIAVEFDEALATKLPGQFPGKNLQVIHSDILSFDLNQLPPGYKVVANVPYYITSKIVQLLMTAQNKPSIVVLLVQKEVAERLAAVGGKHSILSVSAQLFADVRLGDKVPAHFFEPAPKVDSQVVILQPHSEPLFENFNQKAFFQIVKAGFSAKRKKLTSSLSAGLAMEKSDVRELLQRIDINPEQRAENLGLDDWWKLTQEINK
ncbi:MAG: 16S rRNA (adenine(1518)-N(6)/adenine(1519)-N(6))-dimethyltransferase RsmA [Candidatus Saccharibacteria bacterium]|nr:16S rRNA (adenine(1518)-N(6)/adenine(1519)-N(6))-dimethyltransferase RsmA [Candidatus Saccharibacteria bacterium]